jgi:hypothetical protein
MNVSPLELKIELRCCLECFDVNLINYYCKTHVDGEIFIIKPKGNLASSIVIF